MLLIKVVVVVRLDYPKFVEQLSREYSFHGIVVAEVHPVVGILDPWMSAGTMDILQLWLRPRQPRDVPQHHVKPIFVMWVSKVPLRWRVPLYRLTAW